MYRIRFHGRGGQGMKTASRILGTALFRQGFEVQDSPRYGAERRGAPIFAYVRADFSPIYERGIITRPDLIVVADDSLAAIPSAGILSGCSPHTTLFLHSREEANVWQKRLNLHNPTLTFFQPEAERQSLLGAVCAATAACLLGVIDFKVFKEALEHEISHLGHDTLQTSLAAASESYAVLDAHTGTVREGEAVAAENYQPPSWIVLPFDEARISSPAIHAPATSEKMQTGLWRTVRPVINQSRCNRCWWICSTFCPEGAIAVDPQHRPQIDYKHCKGCLVCLAQCPTHAIEAHPENKDERAGEISP